MAQNVTIMGASYPDVPAVDLPKTGGGTARFADPSVTTAQPSDVAVGKIFLNAQGEATEGTGSGGGGGTYTAHIEHTVGSSYAYPFVQLNGAGTRYYADGTDITFAEGDTLKITCYGTRGGGSIYINGNQVANDSQNDVTYTYTLPAHNADIIITTENTGKVDVISDDKYVRTVQSTSRRNNTELGLITSLSSPVAGTYDIYWTCTRSNTSQTWGSQLYIGGVAYGTENQTWSNNVQNNHLTGVTIAANQTVAVYGRSRSGYYIYVPQLTIVQTA